MSTLPDVASDVFFGGAASRLAGLAAALLRSSGWLEPAGPAAGLVSEDVPGEVLSGGVVMIGVGLGLADGLLDRVGE